jgi:large repetitive protein
LREGAPEGATIDPLTGVFRWMPSEEQGPAVYQNVTVQVMKSGDSLTPIQQQSFNITVNEVNVAPELNIPSVLTVDELTALNASVSASDVDIPTNTLAFRLINGPPGLTIHPSTGAILFTPAEQQGPSTNVVAIAVTDDGTPPLSATNSFTVIVREVNRPPVLAEQAPRETRDDVVFQMDFRATDPDLPTNEIRYELAGNIPAGAVIDSVTGALTWPIGSHLARETQVLTVKATDNGVPPFSAEATVAVTIVPTVLRLAPISDLQVDEHGLATVQLAVTNSPNAAPPFTFALEGAGPEGLVLNENTGLLFWRPSEAQGPSTNRLTVRVTDGATPPNSAAQSFIIVVREANEAPVLAALPAQEISPGALMTLTAEATDADLPTNRLTFALEAGAPLGMAINPASGLIQWSPGAADAETTNRVSIRVSDNGSPSLSATQFLVVRVGPTQQTRVELEIFNAAPEARLRLHGTVGRTYLIETSNDLIRWNIWTNLVSSSPITDLTETIPAATRRFYRAISP